MSVAGREFPAGMHAGVLGTADRTLAVSVWYRNRPGGLLTGRRSRKARSDGPTAGIGSEILIARGDSSPLQNILFGAA